MRVEKKDGACRSCNGVLKIIATDDATMEVECEACGDTYLVETDAFHDGGMHYQMEFLMELQRKGGAHEPHGS